jgi:hypothetical protein
MGRRSVMVRSWDARAKALIDAANYTNESLRVAINRFFANSRADGTISLYLAGYMTVADDISSNAASLEQMKFNFMDPQDADSSFRRTYFNNPSAGYDGLDFNGTTQYINTHFNLNQFSSSRNAGMMIYNSENTNTSIMCDIGASNGNEIWIGSKSDGVQNFVGTWNNTADVPISAAGYKGLYAIMFGTAGSYYVNGALAASIGSPLVTTPNVEITEGALNLGASRIRFSNRKKVFSAITQFCTTAQQAAMALNINTLQGDIEAALGLASGTRKVF